MSMSQTGSNFMHQSVQKANMNSAAVSGSKNKLLQNHLAPRTSFDKVIAYDTGSLIDGMLEKENHSLNKQRRNA